MEGLLTIYLLPLDSSSGDGHFKLENLIISLFYVIYTERIVCQLFVCVFVCHRLTLLPSAELIDYFVDVNTVNTVIKINHQL